jgi:ribosome-binding factor A
MSPENESGANRRVQRVERALRESISRYLISGYKGSKRGLVTVTRALVSPDLQKAKIYVSVLGSHEDRNITFESLDEHIPEIRRHVGRELKMRYTPKIIIVEDKTGENFEVASN